MTSKEPNLTSIDLKKYDKYYKGAKVIGTDSSGLIVFDKECQDHEHFFVLLNEAYDHSEVTDVRVELNNPTWMLWDARGEG